MSGTVELTPYLSSLCTAISYSMISDDQAISIAVRGEGGNVDRRKAESLGLIVAELVINSLKHAFPGVASDGLIVVAFDAGKTEWRLSVSDNGKGKQKHAGIAEGGLGTGIVAALASQLGAEVITETGPQGTSVSVVAKRRGSFGFVGQPLE
ncbi:sensor histidine kinase [Bradyrhizobium sp.]|uniref:sensor histidine kinase n=1 Tax=Bradyrhizobium sp. TaxID=376 RepID=UPI003C6F8DFE